MKFLDKFIPEKFNNLSLENKIKATRGLAKEIFMELGLKPIPIFINSLESEKTLGGIFIKTPPIYICINDLLFDKEYAKQTLNSDINLDIVLPYSIVSVIAHECYHYYQFELVNKLVQGESLNPNEKEKAYAYFISLYEKIFYSFCDKKMILPALPIDKETVYLFSPAEMDANKYSKCILDKLGEMDNLSSNYKYYQSLNSMENDDLILKQKVLQQDLNLAISFLNYKNRTSGLKEKYLNIDEDDLENTIRAIIKKDLLKDDAINKLLKKISIK